VQGLPPWESFQPVAKLDFKLIQVRKNCAVREKHRAAIAQMVLHFPKKLHDFCWYVNCVVVGSQLSGGTKGVVCQHDEINNKQT